MCWENASQINNDFVPFVARENFGNEPMDQGLRIVQMFALELSAKKSAIHLELLYKRVFKAMKTIRYAILTHAADASKIMTSGEVEFDESYFGGKRKGNRGREAAGKIPVFGILTRKGIAFVEVVPNITAEILVDMMVQKVRYRNVVDTDRYRSYDSFMGCG